MTAIDATPESPAKKLPTALAPTGRKLVLEHTKVKLWETLQESHGSPENPLTMTRTAWLQRANLEDDSLTRKAILQLQKDGNVLGRTIEYRLYAPVSPTGNASLKAAATTGTATLDRMATTGRLAILVAIGSLAAVIATADDMREAAAIGGATTVVFLWLGATFGAMLSYSLNLAANGFLGLTRWLHASLGDDAKPMLKRMTITILAAFIVGYFAIGLLSTYMGVRTALNIAIPLIASVGAGTWSILRDVHQKKET
jgi:hypothetical protein